MARRRDYSAVEINEAFQNAPSLISRQIQERSLRHPTFLILGNGDPNLYRDDPELRQDIAFGPEFSFFENWRWVNPIRPMFEKEKSFVQLELPFK